MPVSHNGIAQAWSAWSSGLRGSIPRAGVFESDNTAYKNL